MCFSKLARNEILPFPKQLDPSTKFRLREKLAADREPSMIGLLKIVNALD